MRRPPEMRRFVLRPPCAARRRAFRQNLGKERPHQQPAGGVGRDAPRAQVEEGVAVYVARGRAVAALHVVGIDFEHGFGVDLRPAGEQERAVELVAVGFLRALAHDDMALEDAPRLPADGALVNLPAGRGRRAVLDAARMVGKLPAGDGVGPLEGEFRALAQDFGLDLVAREPRAEGEDRALQHRVGAEPRGHEPEMVRVRPLLLELGVAEPAARRHLDPGHAIDEIGAVSQPDMPLDDMRLAVRFDRDPVARLGDRPGLARNGRMDDLDGLFHASPMVST